MMIGSFHPLATDLDDDLGLDSACIGIVGLGVYQRVSLLLRDWIVCKYNDASYLNSLFFVLHYLKVGLEKVKIYLLY